MITIIDNSLMHVDDVQLKNKTIDFLTNYKTTTITSDRNLDCAYYNCPSCNSACPAYYYLSGSWRWLCRPCFKYSPFLMIQQSLGFPHFLKIRDLLINNNSLHLFKIYINLSNDSEGIEQSITWNTCTSTFEIYYKKSNKFTVSTHDINLANANDYIFDSNKIKKLINRIIVLK